MSYYNQPSGYYSQYPNQRPAYPSTQQQLQPPYAGPSAAYPIPQRRPQQQPQYTYTASPSTSPGSTSSQSQSPTYYPSQPTPGYHCLFPNCTHISGRKADLERHVNSMHVRSTLSLYDCEWDMCNRKGRYGFPRKDKMVDHMREVHEADIPKRRNVARR